MKDDEDLKLAGETPKDRLIIKLDKMEEDGMKVTKKWVPMWHENLRYFFNDQLHGKKKRKNWDWVIVNMLWPSALQEMAKLAKNHPKIVTNPIETSDASFAEAWKGILQFLWEKGINGTGMRLEQLAAILCNKLFGYRVSKVFWEPKPRRGWDDEKKEWRGDVKYRLWHPAHFWASDKEKIDDGACGTMRYVTLDWALSRWPEFEKELKEEADSFTKDGETYGGSYIRGQTATAGTYPATGTGGKDKGESRADVNRVLDLILGADPMSGNTEPTDDTPMLKISEQYWYDESTTNEELEEEIPQEELVAQGLITISNGQYLDNIGVPLTSENWPTRVVKKWKQPKYPNGRYVIRAGEVILNPGEESKKPIENQQYPYSRWPFIVTPHYLLPFMWQGVDGVQMYKSTQDMINVTVSYLVNNMKQFGAPRVALETGAVATIPGRHKEHYKIFSFAGSVIRLVKGGLKRFKIIDPSPTSPAVTQLFGLFMQEFKDLLGLQDIGRGKQAEHQMTAREAQMLAISSSDRIALQSVCEDEWVKNVASLMAEVCQQNYSLERLVRIIGEDKIEGATQISEGMKNAKYDVNIVPGATLPYDEEKQIAKYEKAMVAVGQPIPNPMLPEYLRILEIPDWKKILDKYEAWQLYYQFYQLYEQVKAGEVLPQDAVDMIVKKAMEIYQAEQAETVPAAPQEGEKKNA